eukprot:4391093-Alexandrium_andersonii.AAC.1
MRAVWYAGEACRGLRGGMGDAAGTQQNERHPPGLAPDNEDEVAMALPPGWAAVWRTTYRCDLYVYREA